jgi:hypothetical protein
MASTATVLRKGSEVVVSITGTSIAAATEATITLGFTKGRIMRQVCVKTAGSGSTVDPIIGTATNPSGATVVMENGTAAASIDNQVTGGVPFYAPGGILYHRSVPDSASDNSITSEYLILVGWGR